MRFNDLDILKLIITIQPKKRKEVPLEVNQLENAAVELREFSAGLGITLLLDSWFAAPSPLPSLCVTFTFCGSFLVPSSSSLV